MFVIEFLVNFASAPYSRMITDRHSIIYLTLAGVDPTCYKLSVVLTTEQNPDHLPEPMEIDLDDEEAGISFFICNRSILFLR